MSSKLEDYLNKIVYTTFYNKNDFIDDSDMIVTDNFNFDLIPIYEVEESEW